MECLIELVSMKRVVSIHSGDDVVRSPGSASLLGLVEEFFKFCVCRVVRFLLQAGVARSDSPLVGCRHGRRERSS